MSIVDFLSGLRRAGIHLSLNEDKLKIKAPPGALTPEIKADLKAKKEDIIAFLKQAAETGVTTIPIIDRDQPLPLSFNQEGLWFIDQVNPGSAAYNMPIALLLKGKLNLSALEQALAEITSRHEILRSRFVKSESGEPHAVIDPARGFTLEITPVSGVSPDDKQAILDLVTQDALKPFDLAAGPLFRVQLLQLESSHQETYLLLGGLHHIISDGWSQKILMQELGVLYTAFVQGNPSPLPPLPIQFVDYASWQRNFLKGENLEKQLQYWREVLADTANVLALPTDSPRPAVQTSHGAVYRFQLNDTTVNKVEKLASEKGITRFTVMMAAWQLVLAKHAQQDTFCVGIPMLGRSLKETEGLIGFFINALLIRADIRDNPSVADYIARVKETVLGAFDHQHVPLQLILDDQDVPRSLAHQPMAQVGFQLLDHSQQQSEQARQDAIEQMAALADLKMETLASEEVVAKYDMILSLSQYPDKMLGELEYNRDLYSKDSVAKLIQHFEVAIGFICGDEKQPIAALNLVTEEELRKNLAVTDDAKILPLTSSQKTLFLDALVNTESVQNATGYYLPIRTALDVHQLRAAVDHVTEQFGVLRTSFHSCDIPYADSGYQVVHPHRRIPFQEVGAENKTLDEVLQEVEAWVYQPCDIFNDNLIEARLYRLGKNDYLFAVSAHHIVIDGVTYENHIRHIAASYNALSEGQVLPTWEDNFADYVAWDNAHVDTLEILHYWMKSLANVEPLTYSLLEKGSSQQDLYRVDKERFTAQESNAIREYCAQRKMHPSDMFRLVAAYLVKLYCRAEQDFVMYEQQAGRNKSNFSTLGVFYQQVPFVIPKEQLHALTSIEQFYQFEKQQKAESKPYRPLSMFAQRELIGSGQLFFQFNYYTFMAQIQLGASNECLGINSPRPENAVQIVIKDEPELLLNLMYEPHVFQPCGFLARMRQLVTQIVSGRAQQISDLNALTVQEYNCLQTWSSTNTKYFSQQSNDFTIVDWFETQVTQTPDNIALICGDKQVNYRAFNQYINKIAHWLISHGVAKGDKVAIAMGRSIDMLATLWATIKLGAAYIPIDIAYPKERIRYIAEDSGAKCLLTEAHLQADFAELCGQVLVPSPDVLAEFATDNPNTQLNGNDLIYIIYTSGSTGKPKGAAVIHQGEHNLMRWYTGQSGETDFNLTAEDKLLLVSAFGFDLTQKNLYAPFLVGATLVLPDSNTYDTQELELLISQHKITWINCAPSALYPLVEEFNEAKAERLASLRWLFLGGEPIQLNRLAPWLQHQHTHCRLVNSYGPTECTDVVAYHVLQSMDLNRQSVPIGKAIANVQLYLLDDSLTQVPPGFVGEICIAGACVGTGYLNRGELTASVFVNNPYGSGLLYKTGDLARFQADGSIEYIGRKDYQVKLRGLRIELSEIEAAVNKLEDVRGSLVLVKNDQLVAYALADESVAQGQWRNVLAEFLPDYMVPTYLVCLNKWPLTPNGKIDRNALPEPDASQRSTRFVAPRNDSEKLMASLWTEILNVDPIGANDNFFDLGGQSVMATRLVARIAKAFDTQLSVRQIFEYPTVADLTRFLAQAAKDIDALPPLVAGNHQEDIPLTFGQQRIWFAEQISQTSAVNNMATSSLIEGQLDIQAFSQAVDALLDRHDSLRTVFYLDQSGTPKQRILDQSPPVLEIAESSVSAADVTQIRELADQNKIQPFDLEQGPLLRIKLLKLTSENKDQWLLLFSMHHIVSDGQSINILLRDLGALYVAFANGASNPLSPLAVQYSDYAVWQNDVLAGDRFEQQQAYWLEKLCHAPATSTFPADKHRPEVGSSEGGSHSFTFSDQLATQIADFCAAKQMTPFTLLLAAWGLLLSHYAKQTDICIGVPTLGRPITDLEELVGFFINSIVLRLNTSNNPTAEQYLSQVQKTVLEGFDNAFIPVETVIEKLSVPRHPGYTPLVQVAFQLVNASDISGVAQQVGDLTFIPVQSEKTTSKFDITLTVTESSQGLSGSFEYRTDLYEPGTIANLADQYQTLISEILTDIDTPIAIVPLLNEQKLMNCLGLNPEQYETVWPLTAMQYDMFMDNMVNPNTLQSSHGWNIHIHRELDVELWRECLQAFSDSQPVLRSEYIAAKEAYLDVGYLAVKRVKPINFHYVDLSDRPSSLDGYVHAAIYHPYDIIQDELVEFHVVKLAGAHYVVIAAAHHAVLDGAALNSLWEQVTEAYEARLRDQPVGFETPMFDEFVHDNRKKMDTLSVIEFWQQEFSQVEPLDFKLPSPHPEPGHFVTRELFLEDDHWQAIRKFCRKSRITPALYFKCLYGIMIQCYCRPDVGFSIYETMGGRNKGHYTQQGCYIQEIPFIFGPDALAPHKSFADVLQYARNFQKRIKDQRLISIGAQMRISPKGRVGFMFNFYQFLAHTEFLGEIFDPEGTPSDPANNVQFVVTEVSGKIKLNLFYHRHLFADFGMLQRIESLSKQVTLQGVEQLRLLEFVTDAHERHRLLKEWNDTYQDFDLSLCIHQKFEQQVLKTPDKLAVVDDAVSLTYSMLNYKANQLAHHLVSCGVKRNDLVGLCAERSAEFLIGILATQKCGAAYVPMDPKYPQERIIYMRDNSEVKVLLTQSHLVHKVAGKEGVTLFCIDSDWPTIESLPQNNLNLAVAPTDRAYMIYTSGSTGKPKGAIVRHDGALNHIEAERLDLQFSGEFSFLQTAPASSDISVWQFLGPVTCGGKVVVLDDVTNSRKLFELVKEHRIEVVELVPVALQLLMAFVRDLPVHERELPNLRWMMATGEAVSVDLVNSWLALYPGIPVVNAYGPTEAADDVIQCGITQPLPENVKSVPIGKPLANLDVLILDDEHRLVPQGVPGEICIGGIGVGEGYWNNPEKTAAAFVELDFPESKGGVVYKTGDLGRWLADGTVEYLDRVDNQVKIRGFRIELGEVDAALSAVPGVREAVVTVRSDLPGGDALVGYYVLARNSEADMSSIRLKLSEILPNFMVPAALVEMDSLPVTPAGKVDRKALPAPTLEGARAPYVAPQTEIEATLVDIWEDVLKVENIGINDNFFDLGGHSLLATQIVARIKKVLGESIALADLLQAPTIKLLAKSLQHTDQDKSDLVVLREGSPDQPIFYIHPIGGDVMCYRDLSSAFTSDFLHLGIRAPGYDVGAIASSWQELLNHHLELLRKVQPKGPYRLVAQSLGGVLALALADKLMAAGESVAAVVLLDTFTPLAMAEQQKTDVELLESAVGYRFPQTIHQLYEEQPEQWLRLAYDGAVAAGLMPSYFDYDQLETIFNVAVTNHKLVVTQEFSNIEVPVYHIRAKRNQNDASLGWRDAGFDFFFEEAEGDHESMMRGENAILLARQLETVFANNNNRKQRA